MSFFVAMNNGVSGMRAAQAALAVSSQNIANANTPGYVRAEVNLTSVNVGGRGGGVAIDGITRAADRFLAASVQTARGAEGAAVANADLMDRLQALFGDPNSETSTFATIDLAYRTLASAGTDPGSPVARREAVAALQATFDEIQRVAVGIESLRSEADMRLSETVARVDDLLGQIQKMNGEVALARGANGDATGAENIRGQMIDQLAQFIDIRVTERGDGRVEIRTQSGLALVSLDRLRLSYDPSRGGFALPGQIEGLAVSGEVYPLDPHVRGGEIYGLLRARDHDIPNIAEGLGVLAETLADELNRLHSVQASAPPPRVIEGRQTGLLGTDGHNFTGQARVAVLTEQGLLQSRLTIDFDAGEIRRESPNAVIAFGPTMNDLTTALNTALGGVSGSAQFVDGVMSMQVAPGYGLAFGEVAGDESARGGRGFAHFFGLNEIARRPMPAQGDTGFRPTDAHGLTPGGALTIRAVHDSGAIVSTRTIAVTGTTWADMIAAVNAPGAGMGPYGGLAMDANGRITFANAQGYRIEIEGDSTMRGPNGASMSDVFGLAPGAVSRRAMTIGINPDLTSDPRRLAVATPDLTVAIGARAIEPGDGRGAMRLGEVRNTTVQFSKAGEISAHRSTLGMFATRLGSEAGRVASMSGRIADGAAAITKVAMERRASVESVSIDDEVIRMNAYQQAYAASARVIQAANEMWETLLAIR